MFEEPTFLIHLGSQGESLVKEALDKNHAEGVILSPVDYRVTDSRGLAKEFRQKGANILFDPQFYHQDQRKTIYNPTHISVIMPVQNQLHHSATNLDLKPPCWMIKKNGGNFVTH